MSVFREVEIVWRGKRYAVTPTNRLLRQIEGQGISLAHMLTRIGSGQPPISEVALVAAELLKAGGAKVTEDEIYSEIMVTLGEGRDEVFVAFASAIGEAIAPKGLTGKKPEAVEAPPAAPKAMARRR